MAAAKDGDLVKVHYTGTLDNGKVFDSSVDREPLEFTLGDEQVISGFENAVRGMELDERKTFKIPADEAYGEHKPEMILEINLANLPPDFDVQIGQHLQLKRDDGHTLEVTITGISEEKVTLDANHPLAGQDLTFEVELVGIE